jgi:hypothetical protein
MSNVTSPPPAQNITIEWSVAPVDAVQESRLPPTGSTSFALQPKSSQSSSAENDSSTPNAATTAGPPPPRVYNQDDTAHYTALLSSLSQAKDTLNARLTEWKEVVGDKEKHKEVLPPGTAGKQGMGKAMMMVQAAKQADGRAGEETARDSGGGEKGSDETQGQKETVGLPTDDQESDSDEDGELVIPE